MMLLALMAQAALSPSPLAAIGRQSLPPRGCAAYLWSAAGDRRLVAMASAEAGTLRIALEGKPIDLARSSTEAAGGFGLGAVSEYKAGDVTATLDMTVTTNAGLAAGAEVPQASLRIDRAGQDSIVVPVAGLIGCVQ